MKEKEKRNEGEIIVGRKQKVYESLGQEAGQRKVVKENAYGLRNTGITHVASAAEATCVVAVFRSHQAVLPQPCRNIKQEILLKSI